jgi:hypothetical protein
MGKNQTKAGGLALAKRVITYGPRMATKEKKKLFAGNLGTRIKPGYWQKTCGH